jgi:uncharacterized protein
MHRSVSRLVALAAVALAGCTPAAGGTLQADPGFVDVEVAGVALDRTLQTPIVLLRERGGERMVPLWVGIPEAEAIGRALEGIAMPRPMTHDLLANTIRGLGATVEEVVITEQREGTYYGVIRLTTHGGRERLEIDSRPSDGMALALRTGARIRVARDLLVESPQETRPPPRSPAV